MKLTRSSGRPSGQLQHAVHFGESEPTSVGAVELLTHAIGVGRRHVRDEIFGYRRLVLADDGGFGFKLPER